MNLNKNINLFKKKKKTWELGWGKGPGTLWASLLLEYGIFTSTKTNRYELLYYCHYTKFLRMHHNTIVRLDVAKWEGQVQVNRVVGQNESFLNRSIELRVNQVVS